MKLNGIPPEQGLYNPQHEHDACGIGFVVNIKGQKSHDIVRQALTVLRNLEHRGGAGSEPNTGDGAGILLQIPHSFFKKECGKMGISLPEAGSYGVGMVFLPQDEADRRECEQRFEAIIKEEGQTVLGWRDVPSDDRSLGTMSKSCKPCIRQIFIGCPVKFGDVLAFERKLYVIRKRAENAIRYSGSESGKSFYIASLSCRTIVYKGMLTATQVEEFFKDISDPDFETALALIHSRYSTNTFPSWERAHPNRYLMHNGEINTLRGNINWMHARESQLKTGLFGEDLPKVFPIISPDGSDSAMFDNCFEFLTLSGYSLAKAMMIMIPEPWSNHESMSDEKKAFYEYYSCLMEPWDGPAAMGFTDGTVVGASLDRNGLRPSRYYVTKDDLVILASEVGVLDIPEDRIICKERLHPGKMLLIDTAQGRIINDDELKHEIASEHPYRQWLTRHMVTLESIPQVSHSERPAHESVTQRQKAFGYTYEDLRMVIGPMAVDGVDPVGAMGNDIPLAVLSDKPQLLYDYFKQLFAQVTNPPIDSIREEIVTATELMIGSEGDLLNPGPESCHKIKLKSSILDNDELAKLKYVNWPGFKSTTLPALFKVADGGQGLQRALEELFASARQAILDGSNILILSDRDMDQENAPIPALLAVAGLHHYLIREGMRGKASLIVESGEPREVHHFALLISYGASAVNPYLAFESIDDMIRQGMLMDIRYDDAVKKYRKAVTKGVVKVMSKMGISTIQSYQGAQIFEAVGLHQSLIEKYFTWTPSRIGGIGLDEIAREAQMRHSSAFQLLQSEDNALDPGGKYQWRSDGEFHLFNPETIHKLQYACRTNDYRIYKDYSNSINHQTQRLCTLRGLLEFIPAPEPIPLDEVESVDSICRRFKTGAMSYGSISQEAHESLAIAMNRIGGKSNTGEGGEDPARFIPHPNGDSRCSAIKQVASGRFGVTSEYLVSGKEIQIKIAQGAKPGEGGQLPGRKVYPWIARVRHSTPGVGLISPPPHHDIYSIEDLAELIHDLKNANPNARISVKLVSEVGVGTIAAGVAKGRADVIVISGYDGGTGASPRTSIRHAGLPWELGLAETHQTLLLNDLRSRVTLETDGKLLTGRDVAVAALLGAEEFGFATAPLVALGCVMMRVCNLDTCPVGIATQNPELRSKFDGNPAYVVNLMRFIAQEMREFMAMLGFRTVNEMIGRTDKLKMSGARHHWKTKGLDFSSILYQPQVSPNVGRYHIIPQEHNLQKSLDRQELLKICAPALQKGEKVHATLPIRNVNRVVGTLLGSEVTKRYGAAGLPEDTINLYFKGSAGQSFGAFVPPGITLTLEGDANDYIGKGLSGGKIIVFPPEGSTFKPEENIIIGNVAFYGATSGEAYINGVAGERFCVRNSGLKAVVEAVGDHGCEYMTGGRVVVLGPTGRNFAAGMSGGIAYVFDAAGDFSTRCNTEMVEMESLEEKDEIEELHAMIIKHYGYTKSLAAKRILDRWEESVPKFVKVMPKDYKRMLQAIKRVENAGITGEEALMLAFEANNRDLARVSGN
ncbi:MAG: glutamate synthase large subunit [Clostridiales bacterium]|jgi:glutamate synthase (ferredoxin)|nr:glutamate synthase large subunit [Eubacteriales bacterium]MDH7567073.1 glutamate synthase large subunit [Clostridiales bacterium]